MVEQVIEEVAQSFEATWRERGELADKVEALEKQLEQHRQREGLLTQTLVAAEQAASDVRERARREAETILLEAHGEARAVGRQAFAERERLQLESRRIEAMLRAALGVMAERQELAESEAPASAAPTPTPAAPMEPEASVVPVFEAKAPATPVEPEVPVAPMPEVKAPTIHSMPPVADIADPPVPPAPIDKVLPPATEDDLPGWPLEREDTAEFDPISIAEETPIHEAEPEHHAEPEAAHADDSHAEPVLERISGAGSRDFDWGE
jgi:hypothetical protein